MNNASILIAPRLLRTLRIVAASRRQNIDKRSFHVLGKDSCIIVDFSSSPRISSLERLLSSVSEANASVLSLQSSVQSGKWIRWKLFYCENHGG
ncbi:hypothetical protein LEP1GSC047_0321 [Leptospira inadai serovar Lyme str. 10]|uniref:Uncharacterized protein n=1 Tax=Leptospira inadai serovar Lyme str. 10 TaxID=1049790 RepID=V6HT33_9LEPT|nr:hypothetical protein LEP1GSC047_0321 [Leptospira inadai serovar Lyme str. 10]